MTTLAWAKVAEQIRRDIHHGRVGPNGELDTEAELCRRFATSRITVRRALAELRTDGLIVSRRGSGTRAVLPSAPPVSLVITAGSHASGRVVAVKRTGVRWRTFRPTSDLATTVARAGFDDVPVGRWLRLTYEQRASGMAFDHATVWFPPRTIPFVSRRDIADGPTARVIEQAGLPLGRAIQTVTARWSEHRAQLGEAPEDCVDMTVERVMLTAADEIAFVSIHRHPASLASVRIDLPTTNQNGETQLVLTVF